MIRPPFSLRALLIFMAIVSVCLGLGVHDTGLVLFVFHALIVASLCAAFGVLCHRLLWTLLNEPIEMEASQSVEVPTS